MVPITLLNNPPLLFSDPWTCAYGSQTRLSFIQSWEKISASPLSMLVNDLFCNILRRISRISEPGRGTAFKIYLPRTDVPAHAKPVPSDGPPAHGTETILLVEDDDGVRELLAESIARYGYRVLASPGGEDAQALLLRHEGPIHLMLTDVVMPGINGPELYEQLAPQRPDMRVLFMSGYTDLTVLQANLISERSSFIAKPFTHSDLARKIRRVLDDPVVVA